MSCARDGETTVSQIRLSLKGGYYFFIIYLDDIWFITENSGKHISMPSNALSLSNCTRTGLPHFFAPRSNYKAVANNRWTSYQG